MRPDLTLRAFAASDLPMMADWLATPALRQWWGDTAEQLALVAGDLHNPDIDRQTAGLGSVPFGYMRAYR